MTRRKKLPSIFILENSPSTVLVYEEVLGNAYRLAFFDAIRPFLKKLRSARPDLIIADLKLTDEDFLDFVSRKGAAKLDSPWIIVSSVDDAEVLRTCFREGALDYLTKPFPRNELLVKVERFISASRPGATGTTDVILDACSLTVRRGSSSECVRLTAKELRIFSLIHQAEGASVSRKKIQAEVWGKKKISPKTLDVHLFHLRRKLTHLDLEIRYLPPGGYVLLVESK